MESFGVAGAIIALAIGIVGAVIGRILFYKIDRTKHQKKIIIESVAAFIGIIVIICAMFILFTKYIQYPEKNATRQAQQPQEQAEVQVEQTPPMEQVHREEVPKQTSSLDESGNHNIENKLPEVQEPLPDQSAAKVKAPNQQRPSKKSTDNIPGVVIHGSVKGGRDVNIGNNITTHNY